MLMTLGTLATVAGVAATNLVLIVVDNSTYEITGSQPVPAAGSIDYAAMAEATGFPRVFRFDDPREYVEAVPDILTTPGPTLVHVRVERGSEGPIGRSIEEPARYLRVSLAEWSRTLRDALAADLG